MDMFSLATSSAFVAVPARSISPSTATHAFVASSTFPTVPRPFGIAARSLSSSRLHVQSKAIPELLKESQVLHTAERLAGMSRGEIQHIFEDVDSDGSGEIDPSELVLISKYFAGETWNPNTRRKLMRDIDADGNGAIDAEEFYRWMVVNAKSEGTADESGTKAVKIRNERLEVGASGLDPKLTDLLEELGVAGVEQKVTHPLHSDFGRTLYDHFVSCYLIAEEWGNSKAVCEAALFHALYQRGDGLRAVDFDEYRPKLQSLLGEEVEELIYLFPSTHKSALLEDGLLMAPIGEDIHIPNVLEGGIVTVPARLRPGLVELEVVNSHDQHVLENSNPVENLWSFYQHATVLPIMSKGATDAVIEYKNRSIGATVKDVLAWHEGRFAESGMEIPELWKKHMDLFRPGNKFDCAETVLIDCIDADGDGAIGWEEMQCIDFDQCLFDALE